MNKELAVLKIDEPISALEFHPFSSNLISYGTERGMLGHWDINEKDGFISLHAHKDTIWTIAYHPLGTICATGSKDETVMYWARATYGDISLSLLAITIYIIFFKYLLILLFTLSFWYLY